MDVSGAGGLLRGVEAFFASSRTGNIRLAGRRAKKKMGGPFCSRKERREEGVWEAESRWKSARGEGLHDGCATAYFALRGPAQRRQTNIFTVGGMRDTLIRLRLSDGAFLQTFADVLCYEEESLFAQLLANDALVGKKLVVLECSHRDARMMRFLVDALRQLAQHGDPMGLLWPDEFDEWRELVAEARYWRLRELEEHIHAAAAQRTNTITISYHAALGVGKTAGGGGGPAGDLNFRRINRILVHGQVFTCREVFGEHLNENRDGGNADYSRYTSRFYLTHGFLEQAFDTLAAHRFRLVASTSHTPTGTNPTAPPYHVPATNTTDRQFPHYAQFVFLRTS